MTVPRVSVLMTAYNRERFIAEAIRSVLASTFTDFELIVVDDQSKDGTVKIARGFASQDSRVRVYVNDMNLGDYGNRNRAASHATGRYLKYVDADDYIYSHGLDVMVRMMDAFPSAGYGLCSQRPLGNRPYPILLEPREAYHYHYARRLGIFSRAPLSSIMRKDVFERVGGFPEIRMVADFAMWHRLSLDTPVLLMPQGLVWHRKHDAQEINQIQRRPVFYRLAYEQVTNEYVPPALEHNLITEAEANRILHDIRRGRMKDGLKQLMALQPGHAFGLLRSLLITEKRQRC